MSAPDPRPKILAAASKGGHWLELMALSEAFSNCDVTYCTTDAGLANEVSGQPVKIIKDYSQTELFKVIAGLFETFALVRRLRPDVVISTGAAPGLLCLFWGRVLGAKCIWVDSIANGEELSLSGKLATRFSHLVLTQWEYLAKADDRLDYAGSVL